MPTPLPKLGVKAPKSVEKTEGEYAQIADLLEEATGSRLSEEQAEAWCLAVALAMEKHGEGDY